MRVGIDYRPVTAAPYSGIARQVLALEQALDSIGGVEVVRFSAAPDGHPHRDTCRCPAQPWPAGGLHRPQARLAFERGFLPRALGEAGISHYIATANSGLPWPRPASVRAQVVIVHDLFQLTLPGRYASPLHRLVYRTLDRLLIGHALRSADRIWTPSRYSASEVARLYPAQAHKRRVLPNAVAALAAPDAAGLPLLPSRYWLLVGSREPRKNLAAALAQWQQLRAEGVAVPELVIVGERGDVPAALGALAGLHWLPGISDGQLSWLYHHAEYLLHPAYAEGFGLPVIEALRCGTPVVAATGSALDELLPASALRFDPHDPASIRAALVLAAGGRRTQDQPAWLKRQAAHFDMAHYRENVARLLQELG